MCVYSREGESNLTREKGNRKQKIKEDGRKTGDTCRVCVGGTFTYAPIAAPTRPGPRAPADDVIVLGNVGMT